MTDATTAQRKTASPEYDSGSVERKIIPLAKFETGHAAPALDGLPDSPLDSDDLAEGWERIRARLKADLGDSAWRYWIRHLHIDPDASTAQVIILKAASSLIVKHVTGRYADRLHATCRLEWPGIKRVEIRHDRNAGSGAATRGAATTLPDGEMHGHDDCAHTDLSDFTDFGARLDARMTFANFIRDTSNHIAYSVAEQTAHAAVPKYNPLFLHGGVGLGKTHLMQAMAAAIRASANPRRVVYMNAEDFVRQFVAACRSGTTLAFKEKLRGVDVFMLDDVQFMGRKEKACEEFLHTFTALAAAGKQIVVAADRPPTEIEGIGERLRSRLNQGMVAAIAPGSHALRLAMIDRANHENKLGLDAEVMEFLARNITANLREMEGALNRLKAHRELADTAADSAMAMNMESVRLILADVLTTAMQQVSIAEIKRSVARYYKIRVEDILSKRRERSIAFPRQIVMYLAKTMTTASYPEIGRNLGGRDHTTVMYGVAKIETALTQDAELRRHIDALAAAITGGDCGD